MDNIQAHKKYEVKSNKRIQTKADAKPIKSIIIYWVLTRWGHVNRVGLSIWKWTTGDRSDDQQDLQRRNRRYGQDIIITLIR